MDTTKLTPEERQAITQLTRHPGWAVIMSRLCIPQMQQATAKLDSLSAHPQGQDDMMRGVKYAYKYLIETVYHIAELPNPFEQHALGLWASVHQFAEKPDPAQLIHAQAGPGAPIDCGILHAAFVVCDRKSTVDVTCPVCREAHGTRKYGQETPSRVSYPV